MTRNIGLKADGISALIRRDRAATAERRKAVQEWKDRIRDPSLTALLVLEICAIFVAEPAAARGLPIARGIADAVVLTTLAIVVILSYRRGPIILILFGVSATGASLLPGGEWSPIASAVLRRGGNMTTFAALTWVVAHAVFAPGRITSRRLQGAVVVYLSIAIICASAYGLIFELNPAAFANVHTPTSDPAELTKMMYFSMTTLTTTGYGDIVPVDLYARSLANLESVIGVFYVAITVARLVTLQLEDRRRR